MIERSKCSGHSRRGEEKFQLSGYPRLKFRITCPLEMKKLHVGSFFSLSNTLTLTLVFSQGPRSEAMEEINASMEKNQMWLRKTKRKAFYTAVACEDFRAGAESLLQVSAFVIYKKKSQPKEHNATNPLKINL